MHDIQVSIYPKKMDIHVSKYPCIQVCMISNYPIIQVSRKNQYPRYPCIRIYKKSGIRSSLLSTEAFRATVLRKSVLSSASDNRFPVRKKLFFSSMGSIISVRSGRSGRSRRSGRSAKRVAGRSKRSERFAVNLG